MTKKTEAAVPQRPSLIRRVAEKFHVDADKLLDTLKATAFRQQDGKEPVTNEQMMMLLHIADKYDLDPFVKQLYAYPDKHKGIVPIVGVDGWISIARRHPDFKGYDFRYADETEIPEGGKECPVWCEVIIRLKDDQGIAVREYLDECYRPPFKKKNDKGGEYTIEGPWQSHTKRMLRWKTLIQGIRLAFGIAGIYDEDEAQRIVNITAESTVEVDQKAIVSARAELQQAQESGGITGEGSATKTAHAPSQEAETGEITLDFVLSQISKSATEDDLAVYQDLARNFSKADKVKVTAAINKRREELKL